MKLHLRLAWIALFLVGISATAFSQGVTTSALKGQVVDQNGKPMFAASVLAIHTPTGTQYGTITSEDGLFYFRNMKIGGPYTVKITSVGYKTEEVKGIYLDLNKTASIKVVLKETSVNIGEVEIKANNNSEINSGRTGSKTNIGDKAIEAMPTIKRGLKDLTRLTPESDGNSFGGTNDRYNSFSLDGSVFNNSFGLGDATPGGQTDAQPVSLDAIAQVQVSLAPFDVREGGFTGAGVNAVTKSGTNTFKGTVYSFYRNKDMVGKKVGDISVPNTDFNTQQYGISLGGPIIKNKLFFFVNAEGEKRNELAHSWVAANNQNQGQSNVTTVPEDSIRMVQDRYRNYWGYEPGAYQGYTHQKKNYKFLAKIDWNISKNHNLTVRYNMLNSWKEKLPHATAIIGRGPTSYRLPFENSSYRIYNKVQSIVAELNSIFSNKIGNKITAGYTAFRDYRVPFSKPFPVVDIFNQNGQLAITAGSEMFSTHNVLNQDIYQISDNMTYYANKHTITGGIDFEYFSFENSFNLFYYPWDKFFSVKSFLENDSINGVNFNQQVRDSQKKPYQVSYLKVGQLAMYVQDEWQVNDNFNLTYGLRVDVPMYFNKIPQSAATAEAQNFNGWVDENGKSTKLDPTQWPKSKILWSPRVGFNWDIKGDKTMQLRGGTGVFSGRIPFVWLGNQSTNAGIYPGYTFQVDATVDNFRWPQVWKNDLAIDMNLSGNWMVTVETIYTKTLVGIIHHNYNMLPPSAHLTGTGDNRAMFAGFNEVNIYSSSANSIGFLDAGTIVMANSSKGEQFNFTAKVSKAWDFGLNVMAAYTYLNAKDITSLTSKIAANAFQSRPVVGNPNQSMYSWSGFGLKHRFITSAAYRKTYGNAASTFSLFFEAGKGNRYSYVYAGDLNQDGIRNNDLLYVPSDKSDIHFGTVDANGVATTATDADAQWNALNAFIDQDPYLSTRRGKYAERNGAMLPWYSQLDFRFLQDFKVGKDKNHKIQISLDVLNLGNMINSNWGVRQFARSVTPISVNGIDANGVPYFKFDTSLQNSYVDDVSLRSKWQMQVGLRYIFN